VSVLRVTAWLAAPVVHRDVIHLDALLAQAGVRVGSDGRRSRLTRGGSVSDLDRPALPLARVDRLGAGCWLASAAIWPEDARPEIDHATRRYDAADIHLRSRRIDYTSGPGRLRMLPLPQTVAMLVDWLCVGSRRGVRKLLRHVGAVGGMRGHGHGAVAAWTVDHVYDAVPVDVLVDAHGRARRHLPAEWIARPVAGVAPVEPPYWHPSRARPAARAGKPVALRPEIVEAVNRCR